MQVGADLAARLGLLRSRMITLAERVAIRSKKPRVRAVRPVPSWKPPKIEVALVGGFFPRGFKTRWLLVDRSGRPTQSLIGSQLFGFNMAGKTAAFEAAVALGKEHAPKAIAFVARVVVTGDWSAPQEVIEAWRLEGSEPVDLGRYPFE
jgi:hypothetical protein